MAFIGSECYPFVKTGGLGDVMSALPKALAKLNCDVKVILPKYACIKQEWKDKMVYRGAFDMDLCSDGRTFYVGIMEYVADGVVYDFIDNEEFFTAGNPYINLVDDIPKFCYFSKAALAALNYMDWTPDIIHVHDWQAALVPVYQKTLFADTPLAHSKSVLTIHNLRFQGKFNIPTIKYWSGLPDEVFNMGALQEEWTEANMLKGGIAYADAITTVSNTYAGEIQTPEYGEGLDAHLRHHSYKLRGIVNGIDVDIWNPAADKLLYEAYGIEDAIEKKRANKVAIQEELGLGSDGGKFVIGLVSRLTNQKGLDLVNAIVPEIIDGNTQLIVLGTGEPEYENSFRYYENAHKGEVCSYIAYDEALSHKIYAAADAFLVPSAFEPCGLTQLIAMHYGTAPIVRETGGLKDTVEPYNMFENTGNGFTFDRYDAGLLLDAINRAKTLYFEDRGDWDQMVIRDMEKDVSWTKSAWQYRDLYLELTQ
ncbi:MAG: glycogen synthase [Atopobiaceae bacterium]|nr:glycogen synthase [Atopobiaceae bacterium]